MAEVLRSRVKKRLARNKEGSKEPNDEPQDSLESTEDQSEEANDDIPDYSEPEQQEEPQKSTTETQTPVITAAEKIESPLDKFRSKLSKLKEDKLAFSDLCKLTNLIPKGHKEWDHIVIYIYRVWPKITKPRPQPSYIDKISEPLSREYLLREHGSGQYEIKLCDINRKPKTLVCRSLETLEDPDRPPVIIDYKWLDIGHPSNRSYIRQLQRDGILDTEGNVIEQNRNNNQTDSAAFQFAERMVDKLSNLQRQSNPKDNAEQQAITKVLEIMSQGSQKSMDLVLSQVKQSDPNSVLGIIQAVATLTKNPSDSSEKMVALLTQQLSEANKQNNQLLMKVIELQNKPQSDPIEQFLKFKELMETIKEDQPQSTGKQDWKSSLIQYGAPILGQIVQSISYAVAAAKAGRMPNPSQQQPHQEGQPEMQHALPPGEPMNQANQIQQALMQYGGMIVKAVYRGQDGTSFAASLEDLMGDDGAAIYTQIAAMGKEGIIAALQTVPQLWNQLAPIQDRLEKFVDQFIAYGEEKNNPDEGEGTE